MSKLKKPFFVQIDDSMDEDWTIDKATGKDRLQFGMGCPEARTPMDTNITTDYGKICDTQINLNFNQIQDMQEDPVQHDSFDIERLFDAVSTGDVTELEGLEEYLIKTNKKLTNTEYRPGGKTVLMKALLNLKNGENHTVNHLLGIAERMGHLDKLVNAAYKDTYYEGQTALHISIERRSKCFAKMLLEKGARVHAKACGKFFQPCNETNFYFGELPLSLAACTNQKDMVDLLLEYKADIRHQDSLGNTVLHALVMVADNSHENTDFVIYMYDYILTKDAVKNPKQKEFEDIKNNQGLTPIKLAAKMGKFGLFEHILHREFQQEECKHLSRKFTEWAYGPVYASLYDLDSLDTYEKNSVLEIVVYGTEIPNRLEMLQIEPLNKLVEDKWKRFAFWMFLMKSIGYAMYLLIFTAICYNRKEGMPPFPVGNTTDDYLLLAGQVITTIGSLYFFFMGMMDISRKRPTLKVLMVDGYSDLLFFFQAVFFLVCIGLYFAGRQEYLGFLVLCLAMSWINLLYFSRGSKQLGIYSVMIQRMILGHILRFLLVYAVFLFGFSAAVVTLLEETNSPVAKSRKLNQSGRSFYIDDPNLPEGCKKPTYNNIYFTTLELFKFTIGMGDLEFTEQYQYKHIFYVLLISYIVLTYILLLNMLIALMSKSVEKMSKESTSIWKLQRAITTLDLERNVCCLKKKLRSGVRRNLGKKDDDWRWCLRVEEVNWKKWNHNLSIISEEPGDFTSSTSFQTEPQTEHNQDGILRSLSRWRTKVCMDQEAREMKPLTTISE